MKRRERRSRDVEGATAATSFGICPASLPENYSFNEHISLGGEAEYFFENLDHGPGFDQERSGTDTRLILRFRF